MATARPNVMSVAEPDESRSAAVEKASVSLDAGGLKTELVEVLADTSGKVAPDRSGDHCFGRTRYEGR